MREVCKSCKTSCIATVTLALFPHCIVKTLCTTQCRALLRSNGPNIPKKSPAVFRKSAMLSQKSPEQKDKLIVQRHRDSALSEKSHIFFRKSPTLFQKRSAQEDGRTVQQDRGSAHCATLNEEAWRALRCNLNKM